MSWMMFSMRDNLKATLDRLHNRESFTGTTHILCLTRFIGFAIMAHHGMSRSNPRSVSHESPVMFVH